MKDKIKNYWKENILGEKVKEVDKEKSLLKLFGWILFIIIVTLIVISGNVNNKTNKVNEVKFMPIDEIFSKYKEYNYKAIVGGYTFEGKVDEDFNKGILINGTKIINYEIVNNTIINIDSDEILDYNYLFIYFNLDNIYDLINKSELKSEKVLDDTKIYLYNCLHNSDDITFKITTGVDNIKEISYTYDSIDYILNIN